MVDRSLDPDPDEVLSGPMSIVYCVLEPPARSDLCLSLKRLSRAGRLIRLGFCLSGDFWSRFMDVFF